MRSFVLAIGLLVPVALGCGLSGPSGTPRHTVSGTVTLDGKPLPEGFIFLESPEDAALGLAPASSEIKEGKYSLTATVGKKTVKISHEVEAGRDKFTNDPILKESIPAKFNKDSTLEITVLEGENPADFNL